MLLWSLFDIQHRYWWWDRALTKMWSVLRENTGDKGYPKLILYLTFLMTDINELFSPLCLFEVWWTDEVWECLWARSFQDLLGRPQMWFEPSVAFIPKAFELMHQVFPASSLQATVSCNLGPRVINSRIVICMSVVWWPGWAKCRCTLVGP